MSSVEEHFATLKAMGPQTGGWLTDRFHLSAALFLGAHLEELEAAWIAHSSETPPLGSEPPYDEGKETRDEQEPGPLLTKEEALRESAYLSGLKAGWNFGILEDKDGYLRAFEARAGYLAPLTKAARARRAEASASVTGHAIGTLPLPTREAEPSGGWLPIETAPRDGTPILAFCVHPNARYAGEDFAEWTEIVTTRWIDFNDGGWTWNGICGVHTHWMPLPSPPRAPQEPSDRAPEAK